MTRYGRVVLTLVAAALISVGFAGNGWAGEPRESVIDDTQIQTQIDRYVDNEAADRQAVRDLLQRPEVREIAGVAGLDIERANTAVGVLSGPELERIAGSVHELNAGAGGVETVTLSVTAIIIILLLIIILAD
ncbi:MAG TPA: PA2779 family protein [Acidobacteriota bacterium]|nr:PA2779 family protein [Acidobacteriota bacterium]